MREIIRAEQHSSESLQTKTLLLDCFAVNTLDSELVEHFTGYVDTADVIAVTKHPDTEEVDGAALMSVENEAERLLRIDYVAVAERVRGQGLASQLIKFCEQEAVSIGASRILIESSIGDGHKLYLGLGYQTELSPAEVAIVDDVPFYKDM